MVYYAAQGDLERRLAMRKGLLVAVLLAAALLAAAMGGCF